LLTAPSRRGKRFTREQRHLIKTHLPSIPIYELSTPAHLTLAAHHWGNVYKEGTASTASKRSERSCGRDSKHQASPLLQLYDTFYAYLEEHSPTLMPVFRESLQVRGKVLAHISAGMRSILASPDAASKLAHLTKTHLRVGVKLEHFDPLACALFHAMASTSGSFWTPDVADAWRRLFVHCAAMLMVEQKKAEAKSTSTAFAEGLRKVVDNSVRDFSNSRMMSKSSRGRQG
jgi:hemoglobin-like flavoprotein